MKYSIVCSSQTGNTMLLGENVKKALPEGDCVYFGGIDDKALDADRIYVGFWTDKGVCDDATKEFLGKAENKEIFLFGSAGFGVDLSYFEKILTACNEYLGNNRLIGTFMCQGKMRQPVRDRYEKMLEKAKADGDEKGQKTAEMLIGNFDMALSHPDQKDFDNLIDAVKNSL